MVRKKELDPYESTVTDFRNTKQPDTRSQRKFGLILTIIQGSPMDFGKTFNFSKKNIYIGRSKSNDIPLNDEKISKIHCEIKAMNQNEMVEIYIRDLDSTNGTFVNGDKIDQKILQAGDKIEIGDSVLRLGYNDEIEKAYHTKLFNFAAKDSLTLLYNKRYIINELENQYRIARRNERLFSIVIFDIDDFKTLNDHYGHLAGDEFLKSVAQVLRGTLRDQDIAGRIGGEEFLIILPETDLEGAFHLAGRIRKRIEEMDVTCHNDQVRRTISAGVSQFSIRMKNVLQMMKVADKALYEAKKSGKNRVFRATVK